MRLLTALPALLAGLSLTATPVFAQTPSTATLTAKMAPFNYVFGAPWSCTANVPAMGGQPAHTSTSTATFDVAPNNVMHVHIAGSDFVGDQYFGYDTKGNMYWSTIAGSDGSAGSETSSDGKVYRGSMSMGSMTGTMQDTYARSDNNHVTINSSATIGGQSATTVIKCLR
jgi:hypothetical protein